MSDFRETIIIGVGGSLLVPNQIDTDFIEQLRSMVTNLIDDGYQVILVPGGGRTARNYQAALGDLGVKAPEDLDLIGIKAIHLNSELLRYVFKQIGLNPAVIYEPEELDGVSASLVLKLAFQPGNSSDLGAVRMADIAGAKKIVNFSNISHVYTADPRIDEGAEKIESLTWGEYQDLIPSDWTPGMSAPFDPVAAKMAEDYGLSVAILGASIENLKNYLQGQDFEGTVISG